MSEVNLKNKGISLIVLIITIVVIIILTGAIVLNISQNNPINKASEAAFKSNMKNIQDEISMYMSSNIQADGTPKYPTKTEIKSADSYSANNLDIVDGKIIYKNPSDDQIAWIEELGIGVDYTDGLVGNWRMNGDSKDSVTNTNAIVSGALLTSDRMGKANSAYSFDGVDDYLDTTIDISIPYDGASTFSLWFKPATLNTGGYNKNLIAKNEYEYMIAQIDNKIIVQQWNSVGANAISHSFVAMTSANNWYHLVFVYDGKLKKSYVYINGDIMSTASNAQTSFKDISESLKIGRGYAWSSSPVPLFSGAIDDVRIYDRVLSANKVKSLYKLYWAN